MSKGWIKISRKIKDWRHYKDANVFRVFVELLLEAYPRPRTEQGIRLEPGEVITSIDIIMDATGIKTRSIVVAAIKTLMESGEITRRRLGYLTIISITNYYKFQKRTSKSSENELIGVLKTNSNNEDEFGKRTSKSSENELIHLINEEDKSSSIERIINKEMLTHSIKETGGASKNGLLEDIKKEPKIGYEKFGEDGLVELKPVEHRTLVETFGEEKVRAAIEDLNDKLAAGGDDNLNNAQSHYHVLRYWLRYRKDSSSAKPQPRGEYRPFKPFED